MSKNVSMQLATVTKALENIPLETPAQHWARAQKQHTAATRRRLMVSKARAAAFAMPSAAKISTGGARHPVYRGRYCAPLEQPYDAAIKIKRLPARDDGHAWEALLNEAHVIEGLGGGHPNVVKVHTILLTPSDDLVIVMEVFGGSLHDVIDGGHAPSLADAQRVTRQILAALAFCHTNLILHADVKPANVLVSADGRRVALTDFENSIRLPRTGGVRVPVFSVNPLSHQAPELLLHSSFRFEPDIWALGCLVCLLYHPALLPGARPPFCAEAPQDQLNFIRHLSGPLPPWFAQYNRSREAAAHPVSVDYEGGWSASPQYDAEMAHIPVPVRDLVSRMLTVDWQVRPTAHTLLSDPFFYAKLE